MAELLRFARPAKTVFDLLGSDENDQTFSLGFVLSRSAHFLSAILGRLSGKAMDGDGLRTATVALQTNEREQGRTDIQIIVPGQFFGIIEAKVGRDFPGEAQLGRYRSAVLHHDAAHKALCA